MYEPTGSENTYLAFETGGGLFAIPICDTRGVVARSQATQSAVLPKMPDYVKCVAKLNGQLITIIILPGDRMDAQLLGNFIVILAHPERMIGVIASNVKPIKIPEEGISVDSLTGTRTFAENSNMFAIIDIKNLFRDKEYGA